MSEAIVGATDAYRDNLMDALNSSAVLKTKLAMIRSSSKEKIFAYEGIDDTILYYHWLKRLRADIQYEPFVCDNKVQVLKLMDLLARDLTGLGEEVYFFIDRDFDDTCGRPPHARLFMTDAYAVENYIVSSEVLEDLLKIEFHCHGAPDLRCALLQQFEEIYDKFLNETAPINFRIFLARKCRIGENGRLPRKISSIAQVKLQEVIVATGTMEEIVPLKREPTQEEIGHYRGEFTELNPRVRFRGKFALMFFQKWLSLLVEERNSPAPGYFDALPQRELPAKGPFTLEYLAAKCPPPAELAAFLATIH